MKKLKLKNYKFRYFCVTKGEFVYHFPVNGIRTSNLAGSKPFVLSFTRATQFRVNAFLINHSVCFGNS